MSRHTADGFILFLAAGVETAGILFFASEGQVPVALVWHFGLSAILLLGAWEAGRDRLIVGTLAMLATGPVGALGGSLMCWTRRAAAGSRADREWRDLIAGDLPARSDIYSRLSSGQALDAARALPRQFELVFRNGSLRDQQALLGLMAQSYHPSFRKVLEQAIHSPLAPIRVQAASVFTALRAREKLRLSRISALPEGAVHPDPADLRVVAGLAGSPFLDERERSSAETMFAAFLDRGIALFEPADPRRAARVRILAEARLFGPAAELAADREPGVLSQDRRGDARYA